MGVGVAWWGCGVDGMWGVGVMWWWCGVVGVWGVERKKERKKERIRQVQHKMYT